MAANQSASGLNKVRELYRTMCVKRNVLFKKCL